MKHLARLILLVLLSLGWWQGCAPRGQRPPSVVPVAFPRSDLAYPPDTKRTLVTIPEVPRPEYLVPMIDPTFKTKVTRITDPVMDELGKQADRTQKALRHDYAKKQPWNCDGTLIQMARFYLLDGKTYKVAGTYNRPSAECVWSYKDPRKMWTFDYRERNLESIAIVDEKGTGRVTGVRKVIRSFSEYDQMMMGFGEGNLSWDDRYVALAGRKGADLYIVVYDIVRDKIVSQVMFEGKWPPSGDIRKDLCRIDWCSMSASGKYVVILWKDRGPGRQQGVEVYDRKLNFLRQLTPAGGHGDLGYDTSGNEVWTQVCSGALDPALNTKVLYDAAVVAFRLHDGGMIRVLDRSLGGFSGHVSCRNYRRPGWAYVTGAEPALEAFAVRIDGSQTVERFAHTHAPRVGYAAEMHGVPNPEGTKFIFASNWDGNTNSSIYCYVAEYTGEAGGSEAGGKPEAAKPAGK